MVEFEENSMVNKKTTKIIEFIKNYEITNLQENELYKKIEDMASKLGFYVECYCDFSPENNKQLLLGFSVFKEEQEIVEVEEKSYLCPSTPVLEIDKKGRFKFFDTFDEDFLDSINWVIEELKKF